MVIRQNQYLLLKRSRCTFPLKSIRRVLIVSLKLDYTKQVVITF